MNLPFVVNGQLIPDLDTSINYWFNKAKELYPSLRNWQKPKYTFSELTGKVAGKAFCGQNKIQINFALYKANSEIFLRQTVSHEISHLVSFELFGNKAVQNGGHGYEWQGVMKRLGLPAIRCHSYDVTAVRQGKRTCFYIYKCGCINPLHLTLTQHQTAANLRCTKCKQSPIYTNQFKIK